MRPDSYDYLNSYGLQRVSEYRAEASNEMLVKEARQTEEKPQKTFSFRCKIGTLLIRWGEQIANG